MSVGNVRLLKSDKRDSARRPFRFSNFLTSLDLHNTFQNTRHYPPILLRGEGFFRRHNAKSTGNTYAIERVASCSKLCQGRSLNITYFGYVQCGRCGSK